MFRSVSVTLQQSQTCCSDCWPNRVLPKPWRPWLRSTSPFCPMNLRYDASLDWDETMTAAGLEGFRSTVCTTTRGGGWWSLCALYMVCDHVKSRLWWKVRPQDLEIIDRTVQDQCLDYRKQTILTGSNQEEYEIFWNVRRQGGSEEQCGRGRQQQCFVLDQR